MSTTPLAQGPCDDAVLRAGPDATPCSRRQAPWVLAATILASSMAFIDGTVVNVALPALQRNLGANLADVQWAVESYALCLAALLLAGGAAGDRFGRRRVFATGVAIFAAASVWCGLAPTIGHLIVARAVQGIGAALLVPGSLALLSASFDPASRGKAIGTWSGATAMTAALGPVAGGWLIDHLSWRAAFLINVPLAAAVLVITLWRVPESRAPSPGAIDWTGSGLATLGLGALVYGLIEFPMLGGRHPLVWGPIASGLAMLAMFVWLEANPRRNVSPILPLALFRSDRFVGANLLTFLLYAALGGGLFFFPLNLIQVQGYSTTAAGAALLPFILLMFVMSGWAGGLVDKYGARRPLVAGPLVAAVGFAMFAVPGIGGSYWLTWFPAVLVLGLGMSISVAPLTTTVMNAVPPGATGAASGINNAASRVAGLLAIAVLGIILVAAFQPVLIRGLAATGAPQEVVQAILVQRHKLAAIDIPTQVDPTLQAALRHAVGEAFVAGFRWVMGLSALLAAAGGLCAWIFVHDDGNAPAPARHP
ncbi:drug resistance transporter, EmrB/QacA subfamily [Cupriavidus sp. YR651]|uniref:MFS transporter n=1 Tax=Cupriavidus sp. YR651 TaxID=1855315 RepID=UPI00088DE070|nr:MFS transporter [Cupriavidus sp. YR651]SDD80432.1 drug resistance transporter, EmrB/QacA subfamily [Cupriavidus sp. YR651]